MSVSLSIHPLSEHLDMYGQPDSTSAYSLAGHVSVSLTSPYSLFERRRTARFLLQSLSLTFEGQSEVFTSEIGYSGMRLCSITRELISNGPVEMNNEDHEDSDEPCAWNIVFDLPIPGWLPETTKVGCEEVGIRYALYATAKFTPIDEELSHSSWSIASLCSPFRSRVKTVQSRKQIPLRRFASAPAVDTLSPPALNFLVNSTASTSKVSSIPAEILSKIQVLASVPEYVNMDDDSLPLTIRMRTAGMDEADCKRIQVTEITVDIIQREKCRQRPSSSYLNRYPVPPPEMQPPHMSLRDAHPMSAMYEVGLYISQGPSEVGSMAFSLLSSEDAGTYKLPKDNYVFSDNKLDETIPTWYTMETTIPFVRRGSATNDEASEWAGSPKLRATASTPLYVVYHEVSVALTCSYDMPDSGQQLQERLNFSVPVVFAKVAPPLPPRSATPLFSDLPSSAPSSPPSLPLVLPYVQNLPAYSQLYDTNGDRKIDYSVPLPLYTPRSWEPSSPSASGSGLADPAPCYEPHSGSEKLASHILMSPTSDIRP